MKRLLSHHLHLSPKSATAALDIPTSINCASLSPRPIFSACPKSYSLHFDSPRIRYSPNFIENKKYSVLYSSSYNYQMATTTSDETAASSSPAVIRLKPIEATSESLQDLGQVVEASTDGDEFGPRDAQLDLSQGIPWDFELSKGVLI